MDKLTLYMDLQKDIFDYFGFVPDFAVLPLCDCRQNYWTIIGDEKSGKVRTTTTKEDIVENTDNYYESQIYTLRCYDKSVNRGKDYTMIMVDNRTDSINDGKFLAIFDNAREILVNHDIENYL